ncbi:MAG: beta-phosphoglucomutase family hydrolase [Roseiflexaceae bacterium]
MRFDGAIFDVDGVLVDSPHEAAWRTALQRLMEGHWRDIAPQTSYAPERFSTAVYQEFVAGKPREAGARAALEFFGIPDPDGQRVREYSDTKQVMILELIEQSRFTAFEDALRLLLRLRAAGLRLGVASSSKNANAFLQRVPVGAFLERGGASAVPVGPPVPLGATLLDMFDANTCGRNFARGKPDPEIFLTCAAELGLPPARCLVIEDAVSGVQAARAGGMAAIGIARLGDEALLHQAGANLVVTSLDQIDITELLENGGQP